MEGAATSTSDVVRRSGNFEFMRPRDKTLVIPGSTATAKTRRVIEKEASSSVVPVKVATTFGGLVARNGERDAPMPLFYYPGVSEEESYRAQVAMDDAKEVAASMSRERKIKEEGQWAEEKAGEPAAAAELREKGLLAPLKKAGSLLPVKSAAASASEFPGGSVLAQMLTEMKAGGHGEGSVLAKMFVELLAVQRQALLRGSMDGSNLRESGGRRAKNVKEKSRKLEIDVNVPVPPPPAMSPKEEEVLAAFFRKNAVRGKVKVSELLAFLKAKSMAFDEESITGGVAMKGDEVVDWDSILDSVGGGGTLTAGSAKESVGFKVEAGKDENEESLVTFGTITKKEASAFTDDFESAA